MRVDIEGQSAELAVFMAQVRQGIENQPSYVDVTVATDPLARHVHVAVSTDSLLTHAHAAVATDLLPRHAHVAVSTDSLLTLVHAGVATDPPPCHSHVAVATAPLQVHVAVATDPLPSRVHVAVETDPPPRNAHVAACQHLGNEYSCNCSDGYIWSNEFCYNFKCCSESTCTHVKQITRLVCITKVQVYLRGTSTLNKNTWDSDKIELLETAFRRLNGFKHLNITSLRLCNRTLDFVVELSIKFETLRLHGIVSALEVSLGAVFTIDSVGMVTIESMEHSVPHMSESMLKCTLEEASSRSGWKIKRMDKWLELNNDSVVTLDTSCTTEEYKSCTTMTLHNLTSHWMGTYECEFMSESIRHTATTELRLAPLPEYIFMTAKPDTVDCSNGTENVTVDITATIDNNSDKYEVWWSYNGGNELETAAHSSGYNFKAVISCTRTIEAHYVNVTFKNNKDQEKSGGLDIRVIYDGDRFCKEDVLWPKTSDGDTVIKQTCPEGRIGFESRTCTGNQWQPVFSKCVSPQLFNLSRAAENFAKGQETTPEAAVAIFKGLRNNSIWDSNSSGRMADLNVSIHILELMANASESNTLQNNVLPDFIYAASNILDQTWDGDNDTSVIHNMSTIFLRSVEGLVKNIQMNHEQELITHNLALNICPDGNCEVTIFNTTISMNKTSGLSKILGVKNMTEKLPNNFFNMVPSSILISALLENKEESFLEISMEFIKEHQKSEKSLCVFWNSTVGWSNEGCTVKSDTSNSTRCVCDHLTAFSALWFKNDKSPPTLSTLTTIGLSVSICSLMIFLISQFLMRSAVVKTNVSYFYHIVMVNIALFLLLAHCSFLVSSLINLSKHPPWCIIVTVCKHLFFLTTFCWMLCLSFVLVHHLIFVFIPLRKKVFTFLCTVVGYACPVLIVGFTYMYCKYSNQDYYDENCWLVFKKPFQGSLCSFLLPVGTITFTNLCCVVIVIVTLMKTPGPDGSTADHKETAKSILKVVFYMTPLFGLTWTTGFLLYMVDRKTVHFTVVDYSFCILNSFQGVFILLSGCFADQNVRGELLKLLKVYLKRRRNENVKTSTTCMKNK
ncbi:adhesion G protein-coupled receptor F4 [Syngnathoides biaculeatus]|uniref:adhesion G protein-coupled receptor F4 n=1 Tax=Syngnathoides biaculeatus TaxID=300417 RepID=UPI002ADDB1FB|nr:adhesion G protein-coupled receptor F4 [Syngnathoides biaculeatus]